MQVTNYSAVMLHSQKPSEDNRTAPSISSDSEDSDSLSETERPSKESHQSDDIQLITSKQNILVDQ